MLLRSSLVISWCLRHPRHPHFTTGWSRASPRLLSASLVILWCSIGISRVLADCAYKPQFFAHATSSGVPTFLISMQHEWFSSACAYAQLPALGHSVVHVGRRQVQLVLNAGGHAPPSVGDSPGLAFRGVDETIGYPRAKAQSPTTCQSGFSDAVLLSPPGTACRFDAPSWVSTSFDPTLGFPG
jgi:hypothetical protein